MNKKSSLSHFWRVLLSDKWTGFDIIIIIRREKGWQQSNRAAAAAYLIDDGDEPQIELAVLFFAVFLVFRQVLKFFFILLGLCSFSIELFCCTAVLPACFRLYSGLSATMATKRGRRREKEGGRGKPVRCNQWRLLFVLKINQINQPTGNSNNKRNRYFLTTTTRPITIRDDHWSDYHREEEKSEEKSLLTLLLSTAYWGGHCSFSLSLSLQLRSVPVEDCHCCCHCCC